VLPFLNTTVRGYRFSRNPPSLTIKHQGKLITLTACEIAINMVQDEAEADNILEWLRQEINATWQRRAEIAPTYEVPEPPRILVILKLLPQTNCRACDEPTCMVFATHVSQGAKGLDACPSIDQEKRERLRDYLRQFHPQD
jgi:ArsR family metal-binding transcriptional regulator